MTPEKQRFIAYSCSYAPIQLINAAGYVPYRILPEKTVKERAGVFMHDNLCSHVKQILNRGISNELPELDGIVFVNSCDAMRRLSSAWKAARPLDNVFVIELPSVINNTAIEFFAQEFIRFADKLSQWSDKKISIEDVIKSISQYNELVDLIKQLQVHVQNLSVDLDYRQLQEFYFFTNTNTLAKSITFAKELLSNTKEIRNRNGVPVYLFGNIHPTIEMCEQLKLCGVNIIDDNLCTGSGSWYHVESQYSTDIYTAMAKSFLTEKPCARIVDTNDLYRLARNILSRAQAVNVKGVIGYTLKFCDPFLAYMPVIREILREASLPLLVLEGDCTSGLSGQQQTRIEAFVERIR